MASVARDWTEIKASTRRIRRVCGRMTPTSRGIGCLARVQDFERDMSRIVKRKR